MEKTIPEMFKKPIRDIRQKDVDEAIRMLAEAQESKEVAVKIKKPVKVDVDMGIVDVHVYHHGENDDTFMKMCVGLLAFTGAAFLVWWMVLR